MSTAIKVRTKKDDEFWKLILVNSIFTIVLICVNIWFSDWPGAFSTPMTSILGIFMVVLHIVSTILWIVVTNNWDDPGCDKYRYVLVILLFIGIISVAAFRADKNGKRQVIEDSNKNKYSSVLKSLIGEKDWPTSKHGYIDTSSMTFYANNQ